MNAASVELVIAEKGCNVTTINIVVVSQNQPEMKVLSKKNMTKKLEITLVLTTQFRGSHVSVVLHTVIKDIYAIPEYVLMLLARKIQTQCFQS